MSLQSTYPTAMRKGFPGQVVNETNWDADTLIVETVAGIGFGLACGQGAADDGVILGAGSAAGFVGISMKDITLVVSDADKYQRYANAAILNEGDIWVTTGGAVVAGGDVTFVASTGVLGSVAADGTHFTIAGARWMTSAGSGELAIVRLSGHQPAA